ncbi:MAG: hypothetical protein EBT95_02185 [Verrucomicrobia bacterium]|nr:hypothetical protein [Verrucomicrobiota bacterium]
MEPCLEGTGIPSAAKTRCSGRGPPTGPPRAKRGHHSFPLCQRTRGEGGLSRRKLQRLGPEQPGPGVQPPFCHAAFRGKPLVPRGKPAPGGNPLHLRGQDGCGGLPVVDGSAREGNRRGKPLRLPSLPFVPSTKVAGQQHRELPHDPPGCRSPAVRADGKSLGPRRQGPCPEDFRPARSDAGRCPPATLGRGTDREKSPEPNRRMGRQPPFPAPAPPGGGGSASRPPGLGLAGGSPGPRGNRRFHPDPGRGRPALRFLFRLPPRGSRLRRQSRPARPVAYQRRRPGHGHYAPEEKEYKFEPFGIPISADVAREKMRATGERGILSLAYVAAYAASESVYRRHPHPMTDEKGEPKIFNGEIMTEAEADRQKKPKWFWLMNVADDSPWHTHILADFRRALDNDPGDQFSFDGFEIDSYGDNPDARFYAKDSRRNGDKLVDVLHDFVGQVRRVTREVKPHGLVSFNSVNEFGAERMKDVTDFQFLEIWRFYTDELEELVEICLRQREPGNQRVILKLYPADMQPKQASWPPGTLARILGATMTGAGSLMVVGEPDEKSHTMHGLNSLFYPDHTPLRAGNKELLEAYHRHDAMLYGITHGPEVVHVPLPIPFADGLTRTFASPGHQTLAVQILRLGPDRRWSADLPWPKPLESGALEIPLPGGVEPARIFFTSPDDTGYADPAPVTWKTKAGRLSLKLPPFCVHATLILEYAP